MPAERAAERLGQAADRAALHHFAELGHQTVRVDPVQIAAVQRGARVFGEVLRQFGEVLAVLQALVDALGEGVGVLIAADFAGLEQDVPHVDFLALHAMLAAALVDQLEQDETGRSAHRLGDLADAQAADHAVERRWQLGGLAPADLAAVQSVLAGRVGHGQAGEVAAVLQLAVDLACLPFRGLDGLGRCTLAQRDDDVDETEVFRQLQFAQAGGEEVLHFLRADLDALGHPALAHAADDHLAAHLLTGILERQAVAGQRQTELVESELVALGDARHRAVQFLVSDADAGAFADLQLQVLDDQALEHLRGEHRGRRQFATALGQAAAYLLEAAVELALHNHVVVDDGHHPVERPDLGMSSARQQQGT